MHLKKSKSIIEKIKNFKEDGMKENTNANTSISKMIILGLQHLIAMFGATVLVPILTGLPITVALLSAGIGTLIFHFVTDKKGSSIFRFFICFYSCYLTG